MLRLQSMAKVLVVAAMMGTAGATMVEAQGRVAIELGEPYRWTPLHIAARDGDVERVRQLVQGGANLEATEQLNRTPLYIAAQFGQFEVVEYLISRGADVNARDKWGYSPLQRMALLREVRGMNRDAISALLRQHGGQD
ncbi:MAG TPA: ankyrin repeat domain-containing protein [Kiritimatiellia bacterium]|nr:ankyrin repeat domain-containing protein [Kiritimatiellia bacterium]